MPIDFQNKSVLEVIDQMETLFPKECKESRLMLRRWLLRAWYFEQAICGARVAFATAERAVTVGESKCSGK